jgi:hypothetical protein
MPRVVPSQVVKFIAQIPYNDQGGVISMNQIGTTSLSSVLDLLSQIPDELLTMDNDSYAAFVRARADIRETLALWTSTRNAGQGQFPVNRGAANNPLEIIRRALANCPDESPAPSTSELSFISDVKLRTNLRNDMGAVNRALSNGEWKAATVLAGSAIEALLLWALQQKPPAAIASAITALVTAGTFNTKPPGNLEDWNLHQYTEVAAHLGVIKDDTAKQTRLARQFRNFIHPGVAQRLAQKCDRATALSAVAGLEHVVRDLTP